MITWFIFLRRCIQWSFIVALLLSFFSVQAGLVIEISDKININSIKSIHIDGDKLIILYGSNERKIIILPEGGMDNLLLWVKQPCTGPFVASVDGALVNRAPTYTSPCFPPHLATAMIGYDVYAHSFCQGEIPRDSMLHPLIQKTGNKSLMPFAQTQWLMDPDNQTPNAIWYRNLMSRFPASPEVVGAFTIKAMPSNNGYPVRLEVVSYRSFRPTLWYREITAPSELDNVTFDLPYAPLRKDIENHFEVYRKNFKPFDELASLVEGYAILKQVIEKKPSLWNAILKEKCAYDTDGCIVADVIERKSGPPPSSDNISSSEISWSEWSTGSIGETVETTQEADLALCHLWNRGGYYNDVYLSRRQEKLWEAGIENVALHNPDIEAKYLLYLFKNEDLSEEMKKELADQFFELTRENKELMRLRITGCQIMLDYEKEDWLANLVKEERDNIVKDFVATVDSLKKKKTVSNDDLMEWEDLSQTVYSTGLLAFLQTDPDYSYFSDYYEYDFAPALAYVHFRRGMAYQVGDEFDYQHSHFRFLGYLAETLLNSALIQEIYGYRSQLAHHMGITGWDAAEYEDAFDTAEDEYYPNRGLSTSTSTTLEPWKRLPIIEGELVGTQSLFTGNIKSKSLPQDGSPVGIYSADGSFTLLLLDSRIFQVVKIKGETIVRAYGITYPDVKAMTPIRIEIEDSSKQWIPVDIPHSGTSVGGIFNGQ